MMNKFLQKTFFISMLLLPASLVSGVNLPENIVKKNELNYRTSFGNCPTRSVGTLSLRLVNAFDERKSLRDVKNLIVEEKLTSKYFISQYKVQYDPLRKFLQLDFNCPEPLMKVQLYKNGGQESYDAILVETGELYDPTYETLLRMEQKLKGELPFLALPVGEIDAQAQRKITSVVKSMDRNLRTKLSEIILSESNELTIILSIQNHPSSVFVGNSEWEDKIVRLQRIVSYMESHSKIPAIINLTNAKKVVVKFNDKF